MAMTQRGFRDPAPGRRRNSDRGANLVEFALVMPFLLLLLIGTIEFSWAFGQNLDVKHGAREGARLVAVDEPAGNMALGQEICGRMDLIGNVATVTWTADPTVIGNPAVVEVGDGVSVTVNTPRQNLTGFVEWAFPAGFTTLTSTVEIRIEQPPTWTSGTYDCATMVFT